MQAGYSEAALCDQRCRWRHGVVGSVRRLQYSVCVMLKPLVLPVVGLGVVVLTCCSGPTPSSSSPHADATVAATITPSAAHVTDPSAALSASNAAPATPSAPRSTLKGTVRGKPFSGQTACAFAGSRDMAAGHVWLKLNNVAIDTAQGCSRKEGDDGVGIKLDVAWKAGARTELAGQWIWITTEAPRPGGSSTSVKASGSVEVLAAPSKKGETARVRVRLKADEGLELEGETDVAVTEDL